MRAEAPGHAAPGAGRHVLVAPSWGENNVLSLCGLPLTERLVALGWRVTLRPHPSFFFHPDGQFDAILARFGEHPQVSIERSTGGSAALWTAGTLITDYSGMALEFAALRRRPVLFVDGPRKVLNPHWQSLAVPAAEIDFRDRVGIISQTRPEAIIAGLERVTALPEISADAIGGFIYDEPDVGARVLALLASDIAELRA